MVLFCWHFFFTWGRNSAVPFTPPLSLRFLFWPCAEHSFLSERTSRKLTLGRMPCVLECFSYFYFILFFKDLIYFGRGGRRERGRETSMCSCILPPNEVGEPGPQPRPVPRPGIKPATLRSAGLQAGTQSTHRDTPARGFPLFSRRSVDRGQTGHKQRVEGEESRRRVQKRQR